MMKDLIYALRSLRRQPGFTTAAVLTLALGIGLNTSVFGILNGLLLKPLPVAAPDRLVWIASMSVKPGGPRGNLTYPDFEVLRARPDVLAGAFAFAPATFSLSSGDLALRVQGQVASASMFEVLGVRMQAGRRFLPDEDRVPGAHPVTVISHGLWQRVFDGDSSVLGRVLVLNGQPFTIVGVAPPGFTGPDRMAPADLWVPLMMHAAALPGFDTTLGPTSWWLKVVGRLAPGVSNRQAATVLGGVAAAIAQSRPESHDGFGIRVSGFAGADPADRAQVLPVAALLLAITLTVLVIACANVAGLLLSRAVARRREMAIRLSVGASRAALVRQWLVESACIAVLAGAAGQLAAMWSTDVLIGLTGAPGPVDTTPDWRVLVFTAVTSMVAALAFGLTPALRAARQDVLPALQSDAPGRTGPATSRAHRALVVGQLAVSLVLVASAGLFIRGLSAAWRVDVGFDYRDRVAVSLDLELQQYARGRAAAFYSRLLDQVRALPGVQSASLAHLVPFGGRVYVHELDFPAQPRDPNRIAERASVNRVWTGFFDTLSIPVVRGRTFTDADLEDVPRVAIVSETMAKRYWPDGEPLGQRFSIDGPDGPYLSIVGVAGDARVDEFNERPWPSVYVPHDRSAAPVALLAASPLPAADVIREIAAVVRGLDANLPVYDARPLRAYVADRLDGERALSSLLSLSGALALGLAALGLYGVMSHSVSRRVHEIGVRMALGAERADVVRLIVRDALRLAAIGLLAALLPAVAVGFAISSLLVGVPPVDPVALAGAAALLLAAALLAAWLPTMAATRVDPIRALRNV
jgi:predicted permease